jgi:Fe-S-cluster containining protein
MKKEYEVMLQQSKTRHELNKKFLAQLARKKPQRFDREVQSIHRDVFDEIDCGECANCCRELGPKFNATDLARFADYFKIKQSEFENRYLKRDEDDDVVFRDMPCPFIGDDNLCSVYESRPRACINYPHTDEKNMLGKLRLLAINSLYCPAAVKVIEKLMIKFK